MARQQTAEQPGLEVASAERTGLPEVASPRMMDKTAPERPQYYTLAPDVDYRRRYDYPSVQHLEVQKGMGGPRPTIWGLRRKVFYIALGAGILVAVTAIAVGVGTGIAFGHKANRQTADADAGETTTTTTTPAGETSTPAPTPSPAPTTPSTTAGSQIACPAANNQTFTAKGSAKYFKVFCDVDFSSTAGAEDLTNLPSESMNACIDLCATHPGCTSAGWGSLQGTNTCYLKSGIGTSQGLKGWYFAIEQETAGK